VISFLSWISVRLESILLLLFLHQGLLKLLLFIFPHLAFHVKPVESLLIASFFSILDAVDVRVFLIDLLRLLRSIFVRLATLVEVCFLI